MVEDRQWWKIASQWGRSPSMSGIFSGLIFGVIGFWMFREGKRNTNITIVLISIALMVYPYFTFTPVQDWSIGFALCDLAYYKW